MADFDITMKQFNGNGYDSLNPLSKSQQILLNDSAVAQLIGIPSSILNPTILDAVKKIQQTINNLSAFGSYVGTGTYGSSNPNSLTFSFVPKLVIVSNGMSSSGIFFYGSDYASILQVQNTYVTVVWNNEVLQWFGETAFLQLNSTGITYYYYALS